MDWKIAADPGLAAAFGVSLPSGFAHDFAGVVDEVSDDTSGYALGDRVFGSVTSRAAADYVIIERRDLIYRTPDSITDVIASTLTVAGLTASAALFAVGLRPPDTLLIGGAAGGVGIFASQLARLAGARVIGTAAPTTLPFLRDLGIEQIAYGADLAERLAQKRDLQLTAAIDLHGVDTSHAALSLGVPARRIATVAAGAQNPPGVRAVGAHNANPASMGTIMDAIAVGQLHVPITTTFGLENVAEAVRFHAAGHAHGKIVITTH
jgi:NADPH:quinone reductase-like Zn-dependent oxidoreductase